MQCPAQAAFDGPERSLAEGPQRASVGLSWARGKGSRAQALFGHEPSRAWARLVQSLLQILFYLVLSCLESNLVQKAFGSVVLFLQLEFPIIKFLI